MRNDNVADLQDVGSMYFASTEPSRIMNNLIARSLAVIDSPKTAVPDVGCQSPCACIRICVCVATLVVLAISAGKITTWDTSTASRTC